jgi:hypothetical protein
VDGSDQGTIYTADDDGMVTIPIEPGTQTLDIEWGPENTSEFEGYAFYMKQTVHVDLEGPNGLSNMLSNLGFTDGSLSDQRTAYAQYFATEVSDAVDAIRETVAGWADKTDFQEA